MNTLDIVLCIIFLIYVISGYFKGLLRKILDIVGFFLGIFIFKIGYPLINSFILKSTFFDKLKEMLANKLQLENIIFELQEQVVDYIKGLELPNIIEQILIENNNSVIYKISNSSSLYDYILNIIGMVVVAILSIFLVILISKILVIVLVRVTKVLTIIPSISRFNKIGGGIFGAINGIFVLWIISIIVLILSFIPSFAFLKGQLDGPVIKMLIENNLLIKMLLKIVLNSIGL